MPIPHVESSESPASFRTGPPYILVSRNRLRFQNQGPRVSVVSRNRAFVSRNRGAGSRNGPAVSRNRVAGSRIGAFVPRNGRLVDSRYERVVPRNRRLVFISIRAHRAQLREGGFEIGHRSRLGTQPLARRAGGKPPQVTSRIRALLRMGSAPRELINPNHGRHQSRLQAPKAATEPATHVGSRAPRREVVGHSGACSFEPGSAPPAGAASSAALRHMAPGCAGAFLVVFFSSVWGTWICSSGFFGDPRCVLRFRRVFLSCSVGSPE
jgi:hypothetical protein